jgi:hypothetical protein
VTVPQEDLIITTAKKNKDLFKRLHLKVEVAQSKLPIRKAIFSLKSMFQIFANKYIFLMLNPNS